MPSYVALEAVLLPYGRPNLDMGCILHNLALFSFKTNKTNPSKEGQPLAFRASSVDGYHRVIVARTTYTVEWSPVCKRKPKLVISLD